MKKFLYVIILFFIFVINVNAERCFSVPRCNGTINSYVTQCYALPRTTSLKMVVNTPVYSNNRTINVSVNPDNYTVNSETALYIPEIDGYVFSKYTYGSSTVNTIYGLNAKPISYRTITGTRCVVSSSGSVSSAPVSVGSMPTGYAPIVLESHWIPVDYQIEYVDSRGVFSGVMSVNATETTRTLPTNGVTSDGWTFGGWYYDAKFTKPVESNVIVELDFKEVYNKSYGGVSNIKSGYEKLVLYARWIKKLETETIVSCPMGVSPYRIIYNTNGGNQIDDFIHCGGCLPKDTELPTPTKKGYEFVGWYYDSSFKKEVTVKYANKIEYTKLYNEDGCVQQAKVNLYAKWKKIETTTDKDLDKDKDTDTDKNKDKDKNNKEEKEEVKCPVDVPFYTIKYNSNGGNEIADYSYCEKCEFDIYLPVPVKEGYDFVGWYYDYEFQNLVTEEFANKIKYEKVTDKNGCVVQSEITLYAKWVVKQVADKEESNEIIEERALVVFHTDGGGVFTDKNICISCPASTLINTPQKSGYEFVGWYYDQHYINKVNVKYLEDLSNVFTDKTEEETIINIYAKWKVAKDKENDGNNVYGILGGIILLLVIITVMVVSKKKKDSYYNY